MHHTCPFRDCAFTCSSEAALRAHTRSLHAGQHCVLSRTPPFICHCGEKFTKLYTLQRHARCTERQGLPEYPCPDCDNYSGLDGFRRKDHLVQHLRGYHSYFDSQLRHLISPRVRRDWKSKAVGPVILVCSFEACEYHRGPEFKKLSYSRQERNRPFNKQSDYTLHMRQEHDWSPYPCQAQGCNKVDGKGYFNISALEKHYEEKHPGTKRTVPTPQTRGETVRKS